MTDPLVDDQLPPFMCPQCGYLMDAQTEAFGKRGCMKPGDIGVCLSCGAAFELQVDKSQRWLTAPEIAAFDPEMRAKIKAVRRVRDEVIPSEGLVPKGSKQ